VLVEWCVVVSRHERADRQTYGMMGLIILFLPVVGGFLACIILIQTLVDKKPVRTDEDDDVFDAAEIQFESYKAPSFKDTNENIEMRIARETDIVPLADIMEGTDIGMIRGAVDKLAQLRTPEASRILMAHRSSSLAEVRFFVTTALTRIKNEYDEELEAAKMNLKNEDYKVSARFFLAKQYANYAASGLLDERMAVSYFQEALEHVTLVIQSPYASADAGWFMLSLLQILEKNDEALTLLKNDLIFGTEPNNRRLQIQAEILYATRQYGKLRDVLDEWRHLPCLDAQQSTTLDWWST
jgi:hypothetical protein